MNLEKKTLLFVTSVALFSCFGPVYMQWHLHDKLRDELTIFYNTIYFQFSIFASILISIPISVDFIIDCYSTNFLADIYSLNGALMSKIAFIFAVLLPNLSIILTTNTYYFLPIVYSRNVLTTYAISSYLFEYGEGAFDFRSMMLCNITLHAASLTSLNKFYYLYSFNITVMFLIMFMVIFSWQIWKWYSRIKIIFPKNMSLSQCNCTLYVGFGWLSMIDSIITSGFTNDKDFYRFSADGAYATVILVLMLHILEGGVIRRDKSRNQVIAEVKKETLKNTINETHIPFIDITLKELDTLKEKLLEKNCDTDMLENLLRVHSSCRGVAERLQDLTLYDSTLDEQLDLNTRTINAWSFLSETIDPFLMLAEKKSIQIVYGPSQSSVSMVLNDVYILADRSKLGQVIRCLMSNAIKFTPPYGTITVVARVLAFDDHVVLRVSVQDTGIGIDRLKVDQMFISDVRIGGIGLSLWVASKIILLHGGTIQVESAGLGRGAEFYFELPATVLDPVVNAPRSTSHGNRRSLNTFSVAIAPAAADSGILISPLSFEGKTDEVSDLDTSNEPPPTEEQQTLHEKLRILVVDDDAIQRARIYTLLRTRFEYVSEADGGQDAVQQVLGSMRRMRPFHLVLMDCHMPGKDGPTAVTELRRAGFGGKIIGLIEDVTEKRFRLEYVAKGLNRIVRKSEDPELLFEIIEKRLAWDVSAFILPSSLATGHIVQADELQ